VKVKSVLLVITVFLLIGGSFWLLLKGDKSKEIVHQLTSPPPVVQPRDGFGKLVQKTPSCLGGSKPLEYIIGTFQGWEEIQNSSDKYLLLIDRQTKQLLPKVRAIFGSNPTSFLVMDIIEGNLTKSGEATLSFTTGGTTFDEFSQLVQSEGAVKAFLKKQPSEPCNLEDENTFLIADKIYFIPQKR
jgi:hypothetical protein